MIRVAAALIVAAAAAVPTILLLPSCTIGTSFSGAGYSSSRGVTLPDAPDTVVIGITYARLDPDKRRPFDHHTQLVHDDLAAHQGFIGSSIRMELLGDEVWTFTVWRDHTSLSAFVESEVHQTAIREGMPAVKQARFARLSWPRNEVPPTWRQIEEHLETVELIEY